MRKLFRNFLLAAALAASASVALAHDDPALPTPTPSVGDGQGFSRNGYKEHFAVSALAGIFASAHVEKESALKAFGYAMIPGVAKELIDATQKGNHFSGRDLLADALGAAVGVGLGRTILVYTRDGTTTVALVIRN